jgi:hypothetical protein
MNTKNEADFKKKKKANPGQEPEIKFKDLEDFMSKYASNKQQSKYACYKEAETEVQKLLVGKKYKKAIK